MLTDLLHTSLGLEKTPWLAIQQQTLIEHLARHSSSEALIIVESLPVAQQQRLIKKVFREWSNQDLEEALRASIQISEPTRELLWYAIISEHNNLSTEDVHKLAAKYGYVPEFRTSRQAEAVLDILYERPNVAFDSLLADDIDNLMQYDLFLEVVENWSQQDGLNLIAQLHSAVLADRLEPQLFDELFSYIVESDPIGSLHAVIEVPREHRFSLGYRVLSQWPFDSVDTLLDAVQSLPQSPYRKTLRTTVFNVWAEKNPKQLLNSINEVARVDRARFTKRALSKLITTEPDLAFQYLDELQSIPSAIDDLTRSTMLDAWAKSNPVDALPWVENNLLLGSEERAYVMQTLVLEYANFDPAEAMKIAIRELTAEYPGHQLDLRVIRRLVFVLNKVDAAIPLLQYVSEANRSASYSEVGNKLAEVGRVDEAIALVQHLSGEQKSEYYVKVVNRLAGLSIESALEILGQIPTARIQTHVAQHLLESPSATKHFSDVVIKEIQQYVTH